MALTVDGDVEAFAVLYRRHLRSAAALARQMCSCRALAEDVVQEAFISVWRSRRLFDPARGSARTWILGIVRNRAIDAMRRSSGHEVAIAERQLTLALEADEPTESEIGLRERAHQLRAALGCLPPEQSRVIALSFYGGYSHSEIAEMLDTPVGTVKGRLRLGLRKMAGSVPTTI